MVFLFSLQKLVRAIREGSGDTRKAFLAPGKSELVALSPYERDTAAQRRVVHQSRRHDRKTDIEDMNEVGTPCKFLFKRESSI